MLYYINSSERMCIMRKRMLPLLAVGLLLALLTCTPTFAATVCKIGSKGYKSLSAAMDKVAEGQTIKVTKAIKTNESITVDTNKKFILDFANKKYTFSGEGWAFGIAPPANVTIRNLNMNATNAFLVGGTLTIDGGKMTSGVIDINETPNGKGTLTINGGTYNINKNNAQRPWIFNNGILKIKKGTFKKEADINNKQNGKLTISGGTFNYSGDHSILDNQEKATATISGGTFKTGNCLPINVISGKVTIKGGKYISNNSSCVNSNDGSETVISGGTFAPQGGPAVMLRGTAKISGGDFYSGLQFWGKATLTGGKSTHRVIAYENAKVTIKNFTVVQTDETAKIGPGWGNPTLLADGGRITVKGGSFTSPNGFGYAQVHGGKVTGSSGWKKLFNVKTLEFTE